LRRVRQATECRERGPSIPHLADRSQRHAARSVPRLPLRPRWNVQGPAGPAARVIRRLANWPAEVVARAPASIYAKLLTAFLVIAGLLVIVGVVGLAALDTVNLRTEELVKIQRKIAAYRQLQHDTIAQLYSVASALVVPDERTLDATLRQLNQFGYDLDRLQFVAQDEVEILDRVRKDYEAFIAAVTEAIELI